MNAFRRMQQAIGIAAAMGMAAPVCAQESTMSLEARVRAAAEGAIAGYWLNQGYEATAKSLATTLRISCQETVEVNGARPVDAGAWPHARQLAVVDVRCASRTHAVPVWTVVQAYREILVSSVSKPSGALLTSDETHPERRDVTALAAAPLEARTAVEGVRLRRAVEIGAALSAADLEPLPAVSQGAELLAHTQSGAIRIEALVVAQQDGTPGDVIRGRRTDNGEALRIRILDSKSAEVVEP